MAAAKYYIGMLSGTSRDGVDIALVSIDGNQPRLQELRCIPYPPSLVQLLKNMLASGQRPKSKQLREADDLLVGFFSETVINFLAGMGMDRTCITAIGSHGQTVWHDPVGPDAETIQLGDPQKIARATGMTTVGDFRSNDVAAGGQGAPLAPLLHRAVFRPATGNRAVLNLGGIANISVISSDGAVSGFDTGPANCLLDAWIQQQLGEAYDQGGQWSSGGTVDNLLLLQLMSDPYFKKPPPKSTGLEYFNLQWLRKKSDLEHINARDVQATLAQLTASSVAMSLSPYETLDILVCGGGVNNRDLMNRLRSLLPQCRLESTAAHGIDPDGVEAVLFAWLAHERLAGRAQDTAPITGAREAVLLGAVFRPESA